jgi:hypothetical protein
MLTAHGTKSIKYKVLLEPFGHHSSPSNPRPLPWRPWGVAGTLHRLNVQTERPSSATAPATRTVQFLSRGPVGPQTRPSNLQHPSRPHLSIPSLGMSNALSRAASPCHRGVHGPRHTRRVSDTPVPECTMFYCVTASDVGASSNRRAASPWASS